MGPENLVVRESIEVVLPAYNGCLYIEQQIVSIHRQTLRPARLIVRDDGSTDETPLLLKELSRRYGRWLEILPSSSNVGCIQNVNLLLHSTNAPYVALADQDDYWLPDKLEKSFMLIRELEGRLGRDVPLIVHGDLTLIDMNGNHIGCTYLQRQRLNVGRITIEDLALTNVVTGCASLLNKPLLNQAMPIPPEAMMHDWWFALVASTQGAIGFLPDTLVAYRQHDNNVVGAHGVGVISLLRKFCSSSPQSSSAVLKGALRQLNLLRNRFGIAYHPLEILLRLPRWRRWWLFLRNNPVRPGLTKHGPLRTLGLWFLLLLLPRTNY